MEYVLCALGAVAVSVVIGKVLSPPKTSPITGTGTKRKADRFARRADDDIVSLRDPLTRDNAELKFADVFAFVSAKPRQRMAEDCTRRKGLADPRSALIELIKERERDAAR